MANEDFTGWSPGDTDPDSDLTVTSSKIDVVDNDMDDGATHVVDDKGSGHFAADFEHLVEGYPSSSSGGSGEQHVWLIAQTSAGFATAKSGDCLDLMWYHGNDRFYLDQYNGGSRVARDNTGGTSDDTLYYITITRDDDGGSGTGSLTAVIRTGSHSGSITDTLSINLDEQVDFQYVYGYSNASGSGGNAVTGYTQNLDLQEAAAAGNPWNAYAQQ